MDCIDIAALFGRQQKNVAHLAKLTLTGSQFLTTQVFKKSIKNTL